MSGMAGGFTATKPATPEIQELCNKVKSALEAKTGMNFGTYNAVQYKSQVVNGTNYIIKINIGGDNCVMIKVYEPLPYTGEEPTLEDYQTCKTMQDELVVF